MNNIKVQTESILTQFDKKFEKSKSEQILKFLKDQEELDRRFSEYALNSDEESTSVKNRRKNNQTQHRKDDPSKLALPGDDDDNASESSLDTNFTNSGGSDVELDLPDSAFEPPKSKVVKNTDVFNNGRILRETQRRESYEQEATQTRDQEPANYPVSRPWLQRQRGNPLRPALQVPDTYNKPKPWSSKPKGVPGSDVQQQSTVSHSRQHQSRHRPLDSQHGLLETQRRIIDAQKDTSSTHARNLYQQTSQDSTNPHKKNLYPPRNQESTYPNRRSLYPQPNQDSRDSSCGSVYSQASKVRTPHQTIPQNAKQTEQNVMVVDDDDEEVVEPSPRAARPAQKKLLVKRTERPSTAVGLRNHERLLTGPHGHFIDTDQSRSAPYAFRHMASNSSDQISPESQEAPFQRNDSIRSQPDFRHRSYLGQKPSDGRLSGSSKYSSMRAAVESESVIPLAKPEVQGRRCGALSIAQTTDIGLAAESTPEIPLAFRRSGPLDGSTPTPRRSRATDRKEERPLRKSVSCGGFPLNVLPPGTKVTILKLPQISSHPGDTSVPRYNAASDRSVTSMGYYVTNQSLV